CGAARAGIDHAGILPAADLEGSLIAAAARQRAVAEPRAREGRGVVLGTSGIRDADRPGTAPRDDVAADAEQDARGLRDAPPGGLQGLRQDVILAQRVDVEALHRAPPGGACLD